MMRTLDPVSFDAFAQMLARPDPTDLPRRAHVCRYEGDPNRRSTRFPAILMGWLQRRHLATDIDEPIAPATHTWKVRGPRVHSGLRLLRPTGTC